VTSGTPHRASRGPKGLVEDEPVTLAAAEAQHIRRILERTGWAVAGPAGAAQLLGVPESTLRSRMKKLGIKRAPAAGR
jgi:transcriptional regulator with GAF, ATPase, and Fis domain